MTKVDFGTYDFRIKEARGRRLIFDILRTKFVVLTPEELVRQHVLHYLIADRGYSPNLIAVERGFMLNGLRKRFDVVVFGRSGAPFMIVECKAPSETLNEAVAMQAVRYNQALRASYLWMTNGPVNFCFDLTENGSLAEEVPVFSEPNTEQE